jgi:F0F1-type ATP synthase delta subunit
VAPNATPPSEHTGVLPLQVISPVDVGRLLRELEKLDEALRQQQLRAAVAQPVVMTATKLLNITAASNKIDLLDTAQRTVLKQFLTAVRSQAPVLHMSFSTDPSPVFLNRLITWLRLEIHPLILLTVGLQPTIGAGCILRTTNHQFDFSLRKHFQDRYDLLASALQETK